MSVFFTCIILIGSSVVVFALIMILAEKRRQYDYRQDAAEKKDALIRVIEDAELLVDEMNKFSDFVVSNFEQKNQELRNSMREADLHIEALNDVTQLISADRAEAAPDVLEEFSEDKGVAAILDSTLLKRGKVIPFDVKRREIIKLSKGGLDSTQIARLLNMGKGEIELIAKMGR